jgi:hypothetical protein
MLAVVLRILSKTQPTHQLFTMQSNTNTAGDETPRASMDPEPAPETADDFFEMYPDLDTLVDSVQQERAPGIADEFPSMYAYMDGLRGFMEAEGARELADDMQAMYPHMGTLRASKEPEPARWMPKWVRSACRISWWIRSIVDIFKATKNF